MADSQRKIKIVIIQRVFSNYRKPIFDRLSKKYNLLLLHSEINTGISQVKTKYSKKTFSFKYGKNDTNVFLCVLPSLLSFKPDVIIHEFTPSILSLYISYFYTKIFKKKIIVWGHGYNRKKNLIQISQLFQKFDYFL